MNTQQEIQPSTNEKQDRPICVITGANSGIGKAAALRFAKRGARVVLACRSKSKGEIARDFLRKSVAESFIDLMLVDLSSMDSIINFAEELKKTIPRLDVLVHNAANFDHSLDKVSLTSDGFETIFATNYLGPCLLTKALMPILKKSLDPRVITVGTRGLDYYLFTDFDLNDLNMKNKKFSVAKAYYNSKLAHLMYTLELADRCKTDVTANCVRVTNVRLADDRLNHLPWHYRFAYVLKKQFAISPDEMSKTYEFLAFSSDMQGKTGLYVDEKQRTVAVPKIANKVELRHQLWNQTEEILEPWSQLIDRGK